MRRVSPNAFLVPSAVTVMGTLTPEGVVDFSTMSAVGVVCLTPAIVAVGVKPRRTAFANLMRAAVSRSSFPKRATFGSLIVWELARFGGTHSSQLCTRMPLTISPAATPSSGARRLL